MKYDADQIIKNALMKCKCKPAYESAHRMHKWCYCVTASVGCGDGQGAEQVPDDVYKPGHLKTLRIWYVSVWRDALIVSVFVY